LAGRFDADASDRAVPLEAYRARHSIISASVAVGDLAIEVEEAEVVGR
jgi:hypothetical protein